MSLISEIVREDDVALDIGANWGLHTDLLSRLVGSEGHVHAFEPHPREWRSLSSIERRRSNVTLHRLALSDRVGTAQLRFPVVDDRDITALASLSRTAGHHDVRYSALRVPTTRLDDVPAAQDRALSFVKCDVEGHELSVLRGGERTFRRSMPMLLVEIEERHRRGGARETFDYLASLGYVGSYIGTDGLRPLEQFDLERDQLAFLRNGFAPYEMPNGYVNDFLFTPRGAAPSATPASGTST